MTYKQIEASREARLWISQIVIPAAMVVVTALAVPEVREAASDKATKVKESIRNVFKKKH